MPKTNMAPLERVVFLGIFLLFVGHFVNSTPANIPVKDDKGRDEDHGGHLENEIKKIPGHIQEEHRSEEEEHHEVRPVLTHRQKDDDDEKQAEDSKDKAEVKEVKRDQKLRFAGGGNQRLGDDQSQCADDIARLCPEIPRGNNFALLVCLQEKAKEDDLTTECHHMLWEYKRKFSKDERFEKAVEERFCVADLKLLPECHVEGKIIACLLEHRQNLTVPSCKHMMTKMQAIFISDYRLIENFLHDCSADVNKHQCGRVQTEEEEEDIHSQNDVLECLEEHQEDLSQDCQKQIYRLAELSSDDYHLDRPLYYACKDDRERFCEQVPSGEGRVYKCLKQHKREETMSDECRDKLTERQKLEAKDPKANYPLMKNCMKFYQQYREKYQCERGNTKHGALANILICLEKAIQADEKVSGKCQAELFDLRQQLMEDYSINPEIVAKCDLEITQPCQGKGREGKTIDCLMDLAEENEENEGDDTKLRPACFKAIESLLEETGAGSDYRIDHTLYTACEPVVQTVCKDKGKKEGDVMVLSCLMENLHTENMIPECEEQMLHLEFFIARDFKLDPVLQKVCQNDARAVCHAPSLEDDDSHLISLVLSCLYRNIVLETQTKVSPKCAAHVQRVMHQRAVDVHLIPEIQMACVVDLRLRCKDQLGKGEEIQCLQEKFDDLNDNCKKAIGNFTEEEGEDYKLDRTLVRACSGMVTKFCEEVVAQGDTEGVLPCLVEHKNDQGMDEKCHAAIEHWQLIEMKDFRFSPEFKKACRKDAQQYCKEVTNKYELVACLSKHVRDAIINEEEHSISEQCRQHLRVEKEEESEDIRFDPIMIVSCIADIAKLCADTSYGQAKVLECLKNNRRRLTDKCRNQLFQREEEEMKDPELDYKLKRSCRKMIKMFCDDVEPSKIFSCLKRNKNDPQMELSCKDMITKRQIRQSQDVQLDPQLLDFCSLDIPKFCKSIPHGEGRILECLKKNYDKLSDECRDYTTKLMRNAARDYRLDARLSKECAAEIKKHCPDLPPSAVEECLKSKLGAIEPKACRVEIVRQMKEGRTDIQSDPVLYKACSVDVKRHCADIPFGIGKVMNCLLEAHDSNPARFDRECLFYLSSRMKMWNMAAKYAPLESIGNLKLASGSSASKNYFLIIFATCLVLTVLMLAGWSLGHRLSELRKRSRSVYYGTIYKPAMPI